MLKCASRTQPSQKAACRRRGTAFGTARLTALSFKCCSRFAFRARSVQSIMGAMQNRCDNILMLFRFSFSVGSCCFWADRDFNLTFEAFSFHFKCLFGRLPSALEHGTPSRYCVAVPDELPQYRAALDPSTDPVRFGRKIMSRSHHAWGRTGAVVVLEAIEQENLRAAVPRRGDARYQNHGLAKASVHIGLEE